MKALIRAQDQKEAKLYSKMFAPKKVNSNNTPAAAAADTSSKQAEASEAAAAGGKENGGVTGDGGAVDMEVQPVEAS